MENLLAARLRLLEFLQDRNAALRVWIVLEQTLPDREFILIQRLVRVQVLVAWLLQFVPETRQVTGAVRAFFVAVVSVFRVVASFLERRADLAAA
jgi:prolipoprotein diacylglyceryltransferase